MRNKLKIIIPTAAVAALTVGMVGPSYADAPPGVTTTVKVSPKVTPNKAGTKKKPQTVSLSVKASLKTEGPDGLNKPIMTKIKILFPKGSKYNGGKVAKCTAAKLDRALPKTACPKAIMGGGSGHAWADMEKVKATFTLVNGGAKKVFVFTEMTNPALVQKAVPGTIKKKSGKWAYEATFVVPQELQVVAGIPISLIDLNIKTNSAAKKANWLQTTSCPKNKRWAYQATGSFLNPDDNSAYDILYDSEKENNSVKCR